MENCFENNEDIADAILAFDTLYTTNHIKIMKLLLPYLDAKHQRKLAIYIKWQELIFTLNFFRQYSVSLYNSDFTEKKTLDLNTLFPLLSPYCNEHEKNLLSQFSQMQNMMNMMEGIQEYLPLIQQFMSSISGENNPNTLFGNGDGNMMDILKNMLSEEQQTMFSMFMDKNL